MKKSFLAIFLLLLLPGVLAIELESTPMTNYFLIAINGLAVVLILVISVNLYKFVNITKKHPAFMVAYFVVALLLFSSILNVLYFFTKSELQYLPIYVIDRLIVLVILVIIFITFKRLRKMLGTKV